MEVPEEQTHSFVIRLWFEEVDEETGQVIWRGHITHVASGDRRYVKDLRDIVAFIVPYLERMGVAFEMDSLIRRWLQVVENRGRS